MGKVLELIDGLMTEKIITYITDEVDKKILREKINEYMESIKKSFDNSSLEEEYDYGAFVIYLQSDEFCENVNNYFWGVEENEKYLRKILDKVRDYGARDVSKDKIEKITKEILGIVRSHYWEKVPAEMKIAVKEMKDCVRLQGKEVIDVLEKNVQDTLRERKNIHIEDKSEEERLYDLFEKEEQQFKYISPRHDEKCLVETMFISDIYKICKTKWDSCSVDRVIEGADDERNLMEETLKIVDEQRMLLVVGDYGSGKTVFLKKLYLVLREKESVELGVISCSKIYSHICEGNLHNVFNSIRKEGKKHYIILDGLDDLNLSYKGKSCLERCIEEVIKYIKNEEDYCFIIASRTFYDLDDKDNEQVKNIVSFHYDYEFNKTFCYVCCGEFSSRNKERWIGEYAKVHGIKVNKSNMRDRYDKAMNSMDNPLFLYIFMEQFRRYRKERGDKYYSYYQDFVKQTIKGKYMYEERDGAFVLQIDEFVKKYQGLLEKIAFDILQFNLQHDKIFVKLGEETLDKHILLGNRLASKRYYININDCSDETKNMINSMCNNGIKMANLLNCYFISKTNDTICFRDNNILFFLAANKVYESITEVISKNGGRFGCEDLDKIEVLDFYPQIMDYVIYRLLEYDSMSEEMRPVATYVYNAVTSEKVKNKMGVIEEEDNEKIVKILLLYIIFLKLRRGGYNDQNIRHFFKDMIFYDKIYKERKFLKGSSETIYSIERFFMDANISGAKINRINLKRLNFQGSDISDVVFFECNVIDNNFKRIKFEEARFVLCNVNKLEMSQKGGGSRDKKGLILDCCKVSNGTFEDINKMSFKGCKIIDTKFVLWPNQSLIFEECHIGNISIASQFNDSQSRHTIEIVFRNCTFFNRVKTEKYCGTVKIEKGFTRNYPEQRVFVGKGKISWNTEGVYSDYKDIVENSK